MKAINTLFFLCACFTLNAQVLIDQAKKEPDAIIRSTLDTIEGEYLTDAGIFRGYVVRKTHKVMYAAHEAHNGLEFDQVVMVLDDKKKPVKGVLGCRLLEYLSNGTVIEPHNLWYKYHMRTTPNNNN